MTKEELDNWFTYHPPTEETIPKYAAVREAEDLCHQAFGRMRLSVAEKCEVVTPADCAIINDVTRNFAEVIDAQAPNSADKSAAIRCVRLARNAANEHITSQVAGFPTYFDLAAEFSRQLVLARWQANSAIACGGR